MFGQLLSSGVSMSVKSRRDRKSQPARKEAVVLMGPIRSMSDGLLRHGGALMAGASALALLAFSPTAHARSLNGCAVAAPGYASEAAIRNAARAAAQASQRSTAPLQVNVPNGLGVGGLDPSPASEPPLSEPPSLEADDAVPLTPISLRAAGFTPPR